MKKATTKKLIPGPNSGKMNKALEKPKVTKPTTAVKKTSRPSTADKQMIKPGTPPKQMTKPGTPAAKKQKEDQLRMTPKKIK